MASDAEFQSLLTATIDHLEALKRRGHRSVVLDPGTLQDLLASPTAPAVQPLPKPAPALSANPSFQSASPLPSAPSTPAAPKPALVTGESPVHSLATSLATSATSRVGLSREEKETAMAALKERALSCVQCSHLAAARKSVVFGVGDIHSPLMFVGEAPGADEDVQGEPFVGAAGQLLTKVIQTMGLSRETVYIGNLLKCRPDTPGGSLGNRKPTPDEMRTCLPYLQEQIRIIAPKVIIALGATAMEGLLGRSPVYITKMRGQWLQYEGIDLMPTYHPSYVLRNQSLATKRETWEDMLAAMERLGMPISDKQRGYFLK